MGKCRYFECGNNSGNWIFQKSKREYKGDGFCVELEVETPYCEKCGSPIYDREIEQKIREKVHTIILEQKRITKENSNDSSNRSDR